MTIDKEALKKEAKDCVGSGWSAIIDKLIDDLIELGWDGQLDQVKEKFGGLRFYTGAGTHDIFQRIMEAEKESFKTCEHCGKNGTLMKNSNGWYRTLCEECGSGQTKIKEM